MTRTRKIKPWRRAFLWRCNPTLLLAWFLAGAGCVVHSPSKAKPTDAQISPITFTNRHYPGIMFGGWGPHLRGLMRNTAGELWFANDEGPDVQHNQQIIYHRFDGHAWRENARQNHLPGVQQNVASVMVGDRIFSYGVCIREPLYLEEAAFHTRQTEEKSCHPVQVAGKPLLLPGSCNYVGAAVSPAGAKLVWWTTVGVNGGEGKWSYLYEKNHEWIGPIISPLNGDNDFAYIYAAFADETHVSLAGQLYVGAYPHGSYALGCAEFAVGEKIHCAALTAPGKSASDIWLHHGDTHVIAETHNGSIAYYYKPATQSWADCQLPICTITNVHRARFLDSGQNLHLITGGSNQEGVFIRSVAKNKISGPIHWEGIFAFRVPSSEPALATPSALYVESRSYQTSKVRGVDFGVAGHYPELDHQIWHVGWSAH